MLANLFVFWLIGTFINCGIVHAYDAYSCVLFFFCDSDKLMEKEWFRLVFILSSLIGTLVWVCDKLYYFSHYNPD